MEPNVSTMPCADKPEDHPLAMIFPIADGEPLDELAEDIAANGQREPVVLHDGKILDGRRRWLACEKAQVDPKVVEFADIADGMSPEAFVWSKNFHRRHLSESERAMAAAEMETYQHGGNRKNQDAQMHLDRGTLARQANVSPRLVANAKRILQKGAPELIQAVREGGVKVADAESIVDEPLEVQKNAVAAKKSGNFKTVRKAVKEPKNGSEMFDDKVITLHIGKLNRLFDTRAEFVGEKLPKELDACLDELSNIWGSMTTSE